MWNHQPVSLPKRYQYPTYQYSGPFQKALDIAADYGFNVIKPIPCVESDTSLKKAEVTEPQYVPLAEKKASLAYYHDNLRDYAQPILVAYSRNPRRKVGQVRLEIFGSDQSVAEALLLKTAVAILKEHGYPDTKLEINSLGSHDARQTFQEEFVNFYRKHLEELGECCQHVFRTNPHAVLECQNDQCRHLSDRSPRPIEYLGEDSRRFLMEILEYVEAMDIPYRINGNLLGEPDLHSQIIFRLVSQKPQDKKDKASAAVTVAQGDRFDYVSKKLRYRTPLPSVGISIHLPGGGHDSYRETKKPVRYPKIHFIHIGLEAKRMGLPLMDILRQTGIPFQHSLTQDSLSRQMMRAEELGVPYTVIMGLKEVQERAVIVRNMETRSQETISLTELSQHLRRVIR
jgi:histidyl-tRNA synthetase